MLLFLGSYLIIINCLAYLLYGIDKRRSIKQQYRISEKTLLFVAFLGGGVGAWLGMKHYRHKTKHLKFTILVPLSIVTTIFLIAVILSFRTVHLPG
ncbi:DUF1294 domain-containing protein [Ignatzschineria ureiclastica]|uniref:DUF1294 domain-containing protein n=1 Tax=Ignatzschineria ureiclastica TaxID=472582 RepID=A0A2U2ACP5_9GAMM|nr:DUF1294 domain-containing protein [Ignatzschineria ureiclastica]PWD80423.1 DUF1294 domain-containing protein [Ignatzschineria ureiclastica]GGZ99611.1 membrane protein [Ignatzschineria ureiclastica]